MRVVRATPMQFAHVEWSLRPPEMALVLIVKATMTWSGLADEQEGVTGDVFHDDDPRQSLRAATDLAVFKPRGEFTLAGTCYPPGGAGATVSAVSIRVGPRTKSLAVLGDRRWVHKRPGVPGIYHAMPLRWERSFGGQGCAGNPVGLGATALRDGEDPYHPLPNIEDPHALIASLEDRPRPAGAFPIAPGWAPRSAARGIYDAAWKRTRWPWFPEDFDWGHFNAAPRDQQIDGYFRGDEVIELRNLRPAEPVVTAALPGLRAGCFVERVRDGARTLARVPMRLDTIHVDADKERIYCVWRGLCEGVQASLRDVERVFVFHEELGDERDESHYGAWLEAETLKDDRAAMPLRREDPSAAHHATTDAARASASRLRERGLDAAVAPSERARVAAVLPPAVASAGSLARRESVRARHARGESLAREDLTGADLSGMDLRGADFAGAILQDANLDRADLEGAVLARAALTGASLRATVLRGADLSRADLTRVDASDAVFDAARMAHATLADATLSRASLVGVAGKRARFLRATLAGCAFTGCALDEADFDGARLEGAVFTRATLIDASLAGVSAPRVAMIDCDLTRLRAFAHADFTAGTFRSARADGSRWQGAALDGANFALATLQRADFSAATLCDAALDGCDLTRARFQDARLVRASLIKANGFKASFEGADLTGADLRGASLYGAEFLRATTDGARFELADLAHTKLEPPR